MSTTSNNPVWSDHFNDDARSMEDESPEQLREDIQQTRGRLGATLGAIEWKLSPQHVATRAKDSLVSNAQQLAGQASTNAQQLTAQAVDRAKALGADAQAQANDLALAARDQAEYRGQQLRTWYDRMSDTYPWFPAALIASGVLALGALVAWVAASRND